MNPEIKTHQIEYRILSGLLALALILSGCASKEEKNKKELLKNAQQMGTQISEELPDIYARGTALAEEQELNRLRQEDLETLGTALAPLFATTTPTPTPSLTPVP